MSWSIPDFVNGALIDRIISGDYTALKDSVAESNNAIRSEFPVVGQGDASGDATGSAQSPNTDGGATTSG